MLRGKAKDRSGNNLATTDKQSFLGYFDTTFEMEKRIITVEQK